MMRDLRLFLAVDVSPAVKARADELIDQWSESDATVTWVSRDQMHVTLNFLGEIDVARSPDVCRIAQEVATSHAPFSLQIRGAGAFPNVESPSVVWLGVGDGEEPIKALQRDLTEWLGPAGFPVEQRAYAPHLTLGRVKKSAGSLDSLGAALRRTATFNAGRCDVEELVVYSSDYASARDRSPRYHVVCRARLGG